MLRISRLSFVVGWDMRTRVRSGRLRVSSGIMLGGSRTKQSSKEGEDGPRKKRAFGFGAEAWAVISPVGMELESRDRYWSVERLIACPSIVVELGFKLK